MKFPFLLRSSWFPFRPYIGITLFCFIVVRKDATVDARLMRHEGIHFRQQLEMLLIGFIVAYYVEMVWYFFRYRNIHTAYSHISFEREAYAHEHEVDYLRHRPLWANYRRRQPERRL